MFTERKLRKENFAAPPGGLNRNFCNAQAFIGTAGRENEASWHNGSSVNTPLYITDNIVPRDLRMAEREPKGGQKEVRKIPWRGD